MPPCVRERGAFMSEKAISLTLTHRLGHDKLWKHLKPTQLDLPAYSAPALPFRWLSRDFAEPMAATLGTGYDKALEPMEGWMAKGSWVLNPENQRHCLESFWSAIQPKRSLCFFFAREKLSAGVENSCPLFAWESGRVNEARPQIHQWRIAKGTRRGFGRDQFFIQSGPTWFRGWVYPSRPSNTSTSGPRSSAGRGGLLGFRA